MLTRRNAGVQPAGEADLPAGVDQYDQVEPGVDEVAGDVAEPAVDGGGPQRGCAAGRTVRSSSRSIPGRGPGHSSSNHTCDRSRRTPQRLDSVSTILRP